MNRIQQLLGILLAAVMLSAACAPQVGPAVEEATQPTSAPTETAAEIGGEPATPTAESAGESPPATPTTAAAEEAAPSRGGTLVRAMTSEPGQIDPQGAPSSGLSLVLPYLFDTLVVRDVDHSVHPLLAESWEVTDDGLAVTLKLKANITFHDSEPVNAEAVRFTFERFKEVGASSPIYGGVLQISEVQVVDDLTVRFVFAEPAANFWSTLSMPYAGIISPASAQRVAEAGEGHLVGSGPFVLESWQVGQQMVFARNPDYAWGPEIVENQGPPYLERFVYKVIPDAATQLAAMQAGEVDVIFVNQPSHRMQLEAMEGVRLEDALLSSLIYLGFNCQKAPFDEVLVRQALSHAVNKAEILDLAVGGMGEVAFAPLPPGLPGFDPGSEAYELGYNPQAAEALLAEANFAKTDKGVWERDGQVLQATLLTSTRAPNDSIATLVQSHLKAIGVAVEIQQLDSKAVMDATNEGLFDLLLWRYDWNDPDALYVFLSTDRIGRGNRVAYSNPDVDALLVAGGREMDDAARTAFYVEAQQLILTDAPWQPLYHPLDVMAISERVQGVQVGYMGRMLLNDAYVPAER